jgi:membrane-anchored glycerophosphoryl diester phosphodiesterase (GDPDase)
MDKDMSDKGRIRIELNLATALLVLAMVCIWTMTAYGQIDHLTPDNVKAVASMPATSLLALITIMSLILTAYLIRLLFGRLLDALEKNTSANAELAKLLAERPCIRNPKND